MTQKAFSYIRFSTPEQSKGDSLRRQTEMAEAYARERGLSLDTAFTFRDLGISAFSGSNRTEGALAAFIKACRSGRVQKGSALLVESLDRLSREQVRKALRLLLELIDDHGIEVHTLADRRVYGTGTDMADLVVSLVIMSRANEESQRKSERVGSAWRKKKEATATQPGIAITAKVPAWIKAEKGKQMELIRDRAKVVRQIFRMCLDGLGAQLIAQHLNEHVKPWSTHGNGWHKSTVEKILRHPATYGAYRPYRRVGNGRTPVGDIVPGYFPAAIDFATFQAAQNARDTRYRERRGSTSPAMHNLFAGLITDATHGLPMVYYWKGNELVTDSYRLKIKPHRMPYADFEKGFLRFLDQLDWTTVLDVAESEELQKCENELSALMAEIANGEAQVRKVTDLLIDTPSKSLRERLLAAEAQLEVATTARKASEHRLTVLRQQNRELLDDSVAYSKLATATDTMTRARLREEIRRKVSKIEFKFRPAHTACTITFANGAVRRCLWVQHRLYLITGDGRSGDAKFDRRFNRR